MDTSSLGKLAGEIAKAGLPALAGALGGPAGTAIANAVIGALAGSTATPAQPQTADDAAKVVAGLSKEQAQAILAGFEIEQVRVQAAADLARAESSREEWFSWAWRPAMSWLLIVLWSWALLILPTLKGTFLPSLQPIPMENLTAFTGIWLTIYSGGNTALRIFGKGSTN